MYIIKYDNDVRAELKDRNFSLLADKIIQKCMYEVGITLESISEIRVCQSAKLNTTQAYTRPIFDKNIVHFQIVISDEIFSNISEYLDTTEKYMTKSIFQHELFHCKEIELLDKGKFIQKYRDLFSNIEIKTSYDFMLISAIKIWSEFYACYQNFKINKWNSVPCLEKEFLLIDNKIHYLKYRMEKDKKLKIAITKNFCNIMFYFWYHMISIIAVYLQEQEKIVIEDFYLHENEYPYLSKYFEFICDKLSEYMRNYPKWLSENGYIQFSMELLYILEMNGLAFKNEDLDKGLILSRIDY